MIFCQIFSKILRSKATTLSTTILPLFSAGFLALSVVEGLVWISVLLLFTSCSTSRHIQTQIVKEIHLDTIYLSTEKYDSIYIAQERYIDRSRDTLYIRESNTEYRYKLLRDTIKRIKIEVRHDSIPYEVRINEIKEVKYIPPWIKPLALIGFITILVLLVYTITKLKRF